MLNHKYRIFIIGLMVVGCVSTPNQNDSVSLPTPASEDAKYTNTDTRDLTFLDSSTETRSSFAQLNTSLCHPSRKKVNLSTQIATPFGQETVRMQFELGSSEIMMSIQDKEFYVSDAKTLDILTHQLCESEEKSEKISEVDLFELKLKVHTWLSAGIPDCDFFLHQSIWQCSLSGYNSETTIQKMQELKKSMVTTWTRQPYVLARRASMTFELAKIVSQPELESKLPRFCRLMKLSFKDELPLVMSSDRWLNAVCKSDTLSENSRKLMEYAFQKATEELTYLGRLYEKTSRTGFFSVRIPKKDIPLETGNTTPGDSLFVTITPTEDVSHSLQTQLRTGVKPDPTEQMNRPCWHPLFSESDQMLTTAKVLNLIGVSDGVRCRTVSDSAMLLKSSKYLVSSLAGETEFTIQNGKSHVLRLPKGNYAYKIQKALPAKFPNFELETADEEEAKDSNKFKELSRGELHWESSRPSTVIKNW